MTTSESPEVLQDAVKSEEEVSPPCDTSPPAPVSPAASKNGGATDDNSAPAANDAEILEQKITKTCEALQISPILYKALFNGNPKDRYFILRLERDLRSFITSETVSWRLQPLNSYYRLLVHQIASYYSMGHILLKDGASMVIFKENTSVVNGNNNNKYASKTDEDDDDAAEDEQEGTPTGAKLDKLKLGDIPNDLFEDVEISNDISDDFLIKNGLHQTSLPHQNYHHHTGPNQMYYKQRNTNYGYQNGRNMKYYNNNIGGNPANASKPYKLIKRKDNSPTASATTESSSTTGESVQDDQADLSLESERASKEEQYNRAREEIFQEGDVEQGSEQDGAQQQQAPRYNNRNQYQRRSPYNKHAQSNGYLPPPPPPFGYPPSYGYYAAPPPPPQGFIPNGDGFDKDSLQQFPPQFIYANPAGAFQQAPAYYYPVPPPNGNNRRGNYGYGRRGNYNGQANRKYNNGGNKNYQNYKSEATQAKDEDNGNGNGEVVTEASEQITDNVAQASVEASADEK